MKFFPRRHKAGFQELDPDQPKKKPSKPKPKPEFLLQPASGKGCLSRQYYDDDDEDGIATTKSCLRLPQCRPKRRPIHKGNSAAEDLKLHFETGLNILSVDDDPKTEDYNHQEGHNNAAILEDLSIAVSISAASFGSQQVFETRMSSSQPKPKQKSSSARQQQQEAIEVKRKELSTRRRRTQENTEHTEETKSPPLQTKNQQQQQEVVLPSSFGDERDVVESKRMQQLEQQQQQQQQHYHTQPQSQSQSPSIGMFTSKQKEVSDAADAAMYAFYHQPQQPHHQPQQVPVDAQSAQALQQELETSEAMADDDLEEQDDTRLLPVSSYPTLDDTHVRGLANIPERFDNDNSSIDTHSSSSQEEGQPGRYALQQQHTSYSEDVGDPELQEEVTSYASLSSTPDHNETLLADAIPTSLFHSSTKQQHHHEEHPPPPPRFREHYPSKSHNADKTTVPKPNGDDSATKPPKNGTITAQSRSVFAKFHAAKAKHPIPNNDNNDDDSPKSAPQQQQQDNTFHIDKLVIDSQLSILSQIHTQDFPGLPAADSLLPTLSAEDFPGLPQVDSFLSQVSSRSQECAANAIVSDREGNSRDHPEGVEHAVVWKKPTVRTNGDARGTPLQQEDDTSLPAAAVLSQEVSTKQAHGPKDNRINQSLGQGSVPSSLRQVASECDSSTPTVLRDNTLGYHTKGELYAKQQQQMMQQTSLSTIRDNESLLDQDTDSGANSGANDNDNQDVKSDIYSVPVVRRSSGGNANNGDMYSLPLPEPVMMPMSLSPPRKQNGSSWRFAPEYQDTVSPSPTRRGRAIVSPISQIHHPTVPSATYSMHESQKLTPPPPPVAASPFESRLRQRMNAIQSTNLGIFPATHPDKPPPTEDAEIDLVQWPSGESPEPIMFTQSNSEILEDDDVPVETGIEICYSNDMQDTGNLLATGPEEMPYSATRDTHSGDNAKVRTTQQKLAKFLLFDENEDAPMFDQEHPNRSPTSASAFSPSFQTPATRHTIHTSSDSMPEKRQLHQHLVTPEVHRNRTGSPTGSLPSTASSSRVQMYWSQQISTSRHSGPDPTKAGVPERSRQQQQPRPRVSAKILALQRQFAGE